MLGRRALRLFGELRSIADATSTRGVASTPFLIRRELPSLCTAQQRWWHTSSPVLAGHAHGAARTKDDQSHKHHTKKADGHSSKKTDSHHVKKSEDHHTKHKDHHAHTADDSHEITPSKTHSDSPTKRFKTAEEHQAEHHAAMAGEKEIKVTDASNKDITKSTEKYAHFADFPDVPSWLKRGIDALGFKEPTDIQKITMPLLHQGHDVIGLAPTGSGKTIAFAVPALATFQRNEGGNPAILVLAPVRELVQQTARVFRQLGGNDLIVAEAYGGEPRYLQAQRLKAGCDVLVACPGRLKDFLKTGTVSLDQVSFLVLDEADRLLDMGFKEQLDEIFAYIDPERPRQSMMWSATWPTQVQHLAKEYMSPERIMVRTGTAGEQAQVNVNIKQEVFVVRSRREKMHRLEQIFQEEAFRDLGKVIIFVERQIDCDNVAQALVDEVHVDEHLIAAIHGGLHQMYRDQIMKAFKHNQVRFLVATDVASRGLDFPDITAVINFDAPKQLDSYCHRIGRTGRAGRRGKAFTFVDHRPSALCGPLADYLRRCKMPIPQELEGLSEDWKRIEENRMRKWKKFGDSRGFRR